MGVTGNGGARGVRKHVTERARTNQRAKRETPNGVAGGEKYKWPV